MRFADRHDAGRQLAALLTGAPDLVLALPRGGVPVGVEVARATGAPLQVYVARKIGLPDSPEVGIGALAEDGVVRWDLDRLRRLGLTADDLAATVAAEQDELVRRRRRYRGDAPLEVSGRDVLLVDDGLATGVTARAALAALGSAGARVALAVPVGDAAAVRELGAVAVVSTDDLVAVGRWYDRFEQLTDEEVLAELRSLTA